MEFHNLETTRSNFYSDKSTFLNKSSAPRFTVKKRPSHWNNLISVYVSPLNLTLVYIIINRRNNFFGIENNNNIMLFKYNIGTI